MTKPDAQSGISEATAHARLAGGVKTVVYRALRSLVCSTCARPIEPETLFTRCALPGSTLLIMPQCIECVPFEIERENRARSALVRSLLGVPPPPAREIAAKQTGEHPRDEAGDEGEAAKVRREIERRLGPALRRTRRTAR